MEKIPELIREYRDMDGLVTHLRDAKRIAVDLETTGLRPYHADIITGVAVGWEDQEGEKHSTYIAIYCPQAGPVVSMPLVLTDLDLGGVWRDDRPVRGHNFLFDLRFMAKAGLDLNIIGPCRDTQTLARIALSANADTAYKRLGLKVLADEYKLPGGAAEGSALKKMMKKNKWDWCDVPVDILAPYARQDVLLTMAVEDIMMAKIDERQMEVVDNESRLLPVIARMSHRGVKIDTEYLERIHKEVIHDKLEKSRRDVIGFLGHDEIRSNPKLGKALLELHLPVGTNARTGHHYLAADDLGQLDHPAIPAILRMRTYDHYATVIAGLLEGADAHDIIHTFLSPHAAITGRFSSQDPNLQNLPRDEPHPIRRKGKTVDELVLPSIRKAFVARRGTTLLLTDYQQMEAAVLADFANDKAMLKIVNSGGDVHAGTARLLFKGYEAADAEGRKLYRQNAKSINFSILYGAGVNKLATMLHRAQDHARAFRQHYFDVFEEVREFTNVRVRNRITAVGQVRNRMGRLYGVPLDRAYIAVNYLVQGTCADLIKRQMIELDRMSILTMQIHDEVGQEVEGDPTMVKAQARLTEKILEDVKDKLTRVNLRTDSKAGPNWAETEAV